MDKDKVESILKMRRKFGLKIEMDPYAVNIAGILRRPSILHPIKRMRFSKEFDLRVAIVMAEYAETLINAIKERQ